MMEVQLVMENRSFQKILDLSINQTLNDLKTANGISMRESSTLNILKSSKNSSLAILFLNLGSTLC